VPVVHISILPARYCSAQIMLANNEYPDAFPDLNPVDTLRIGISDQLSKVTGIAKSDIYNGLAWTNNLDKGDLVLAVPRFRIKGTPPKDIAVKWQSEVSSTFYTTASAHRTLY
jgi:hypothetical protein